MKNIFLLFSICWFSSTTFAQEVTTKDFKKLYWLIGEWNRTNVTPGNSGLEKWAKSSDKELQGWGFSFKGADTTFIENTKLVSDNNHIYYVAEVAENKEPVRFKLTSI